MRCFVPSLLYLSLLLLPACGTKSAPAPQSSVQTPGENPAPGDNPGTPTPPPPPVAPTATFDANAVDLGTAGGFPSDLVVSNNTLFTVDDATIPAHVVAYALTSTGPASQPLWSVAITTNDLVDFDGTKPARAPTAVGNGLFGAYTGDLELAAGRYLLVTVGAGNSMSTDSNGPLVLADLVVVDTVAQRVVQTVNLAFPLKRDVSMSTGLPIHSLLQSLPVMSAFVPDAPGSQQGRVFVAMSNGAGTSAGLATFYPGTVQVWRADFSLAPPLSPQSVGKEPTDITRVFLSTRYNPVALTPHHSANGFDYLMITSAGASIFDSTTGVTQPTTNAFLEFLDTGAGQWRDLWAVDLGAILPAPARLAVGSDAAGHTFGLLGSQTYAAAYAVDLSGLETNPVDPQKLSLLRSIPLQAGGAVTAGSGFEPGCVLAPGGRHAVLSTFSPAGLVVLGIPDDVATGGFPIDASPFDAVGLTVGDAFGLGAVAASPGPGPEIYALVNGNFDAAFNPTRHDGVASLSAPSVLR